MIPSLSVVVISFNSIDLLQRCLASLQGQPLSPGLETVVVGSWTDRERELLQRQFPDNRWVRAAPGQNVPQLRSTGMVHCTGDVIALIEDDCVAEESWCSRLLAAHRSRFAAIGGAVQPGAYRSSLDWAVYFSEYGRFMPPLRGGDVRALPGTNVSYKRTALVRLGYIPEGHGESTASIGSTNPSRGFYEAFEHAELERAGLQLKLDPALVVTNVNSWTGRSAVRTRFHHGRGFAGMRVAGLPMPQRVPYLGLAIVLPAVQAVRIAKEVGSRRRYSRQFARSLPWIVLLSISWSVGELVGYAFGPGRSLQQWA